ncbi:proline-rich receptor-like protein kinase PERK9 [Phoenix dactylifera]|uniref:Proline-rich receptor-like protein kinase PERK9 n=1 Tax=Phoenix dactylifera TaxID=42345 RepID=A0A8B9APL0_PHODC|nr:proline-rich receptor-like protein kinase PERK9 [Phoenix dactylifera]
MEAASKNPPEAAEVTAYISEVRLESSSATVGFSEPCPCCGNRKRRCLHPPSRSRKKLLVFEPASASVPSPSPSPTRPALLRSESSPLPSSSRRAGLSLAPSPPSPSAFLRSHSFPSAPLDRTVSPAFPPLVESPAEAFRSPPPTAAPPFVHLRSDPVPPMSPPSLLVPALSDRRSDRSNSSAGTPPAADTAITCPASSNRRVRMKDGGASSERGMAEWRKREAVRVSVNCECGVVREVVLLQQ